MALVVTETQTGTAAQDSPDSPQTSAPLGHTDDPYYRVLEGIPDGVVVTSNGVIAYANPAFALLVDRDRPDLIGKTLTSLMAPAYRTAFDTHCKSPNHSFEMTCRLIISGRAIPAVIHGNTNSPSVNGEDLTETGETDACPVVAIVTIQGMEGSDPTVVDGVMPLQDRLRDALEQLPISVMITDTQGVIEYINPSFCRVMGHKPEDALGMTPRLLKSERMHPKSYAGMWGNLRKGQSWSGDMHNKRKDGSLIWQRAMITPLRDSRGSFTHFMALYEDITEKKLMEGKVWRQAHHDVLTDLPNRTLLNDRLEQAIAVAKRHKTSVAILFIDLDHFKNVNDHFGHAVGDQVLRQAADRILTCIRKTDTLSRLGGDEFVVLLVHEGSERDDATVGERILKSLREPFIIEGREIMTGASMGISVFPEDGEDAEQLISNADSAMYQSKTQGRNSFTFFTSELDAEIQAQIRLEGELRQAVADMDLMVYFQPFVDSRSLNIMGAEALVRWPNKDRGFVPPSRFIPIAEELGLIDDIGGWVLYSACSQAKIWQDKLHPRFRIAVNISGRQIQQPYFVSRIQEVLDASGLPSELLELEVSESVLMSDVDTIGPALRQLADMGVRLAVDNFGTSHASIKHLRAHPFHILKLDRSCVKDVLESAEDALLVETAITMARRMGLSVVAEGVETEEQLGFLREHYCDLIQGYLFGQPLPADEFMKML